MKKTIQYSIIFVMSVLLGIFLVLNMKQDMSGYTQVSLKSIQMLKDEIDNQKNQINDIKKMIVKKNEEIKIFEDTVNKNGDITEHIKEEIEFMKFVSGYTDVYGPGIYVTVSDSEAKYVPGTNISAEIVHDIDVQTLINDLKVAGAEAISVKGQRVLSYSEVECNGPTIRINGRKYSIPFVIKAVGDPKVLNAAINAPGTYGYKLKEIFDLKVETKQSNYLLIPKYEGYVNYEYANPVKEGE